MLDHLISWAALLFSGIALIVAMRVQRRQPELIAKQIAELDRGARQRYEARLVARIQMLPGPEGARGLCKLSITNEGPSEARVIDVRFPNGDSPIRDKEVRAKLPVPVLQAGGSCNLYGKLSGTAPPFHVILVWRDGRGDQTQETTLTL